MNIKEAVNNIVYMEVWKLFNATVGNETAQLHTEKLTKASELIAEKLDKANLLNNPKYLDSIRAKIGEITEKVSQKRGIRK